MIYQHQHEEKEADAVTVDSHVFVGVDATRSESSHVIADGNHVNVSKLRDGLTCDDVMPDIHEK